MYKNHCLTCGEIHKGECKMPKIKGISKNNYSSIPNKLDEVKDLNNMEEKQNELTLEKMNNIISQIPVVCDHGMNRDYRCSQCNPNDAKVFERGVQEGKKMEERNTLASNIALLTLLVERGTKGDMERLIKEFTEKLELLDSSQTEEGLEGIK